MLGHFVLESMFRVIMLSNLQIEIEEHDSIIGKYALLGTYIFR